MKINKSAYRVTVVKTAFEINTRSLEMNRSYRVAYAKIVSVKICIVNALKLGKNVIQEYVAAANVKIF